MENKKMKKIITIFAIAILALTGTIFAYQNGMMKNSSEETKLNYAQTQGYEKGTYHEQVESIIENGSYQDLVNLREELGFDVMRKVQSEEDFIAQQQRHLENKEAGLEPGYLRNEKGNGQGSGLRNGSGNMQGNNQKGMGNSENCPYLN